MEVLGFNRDAVDCRDNVNKGISIYYIRYSLWEEECDGADFLTAFIFKIFSSEMLLHFTQATQLNISEF